MATNNQTPRSDFGKLPALGNFPTSGPNAEKGNKKRQRAAAPAAGAQVGEGSGRGNFGSKVREALSLSTFYFCQFAP